jgi:hypothetical protein
MSTLLYSGVRNILRCDDAEVVAAIASYVVSQHRLLKLLAWLIERTRGTSFPGLISTIGWVRCFGAVRSDSSLKGVAWLARLSNERPPIETFVSLAPDLNWTELKFQSRPIMKSFTTAKVNPRRIFQLTRLLHRRYDFFKVLRVVELIAYYARYSELFRQREFKLAVMSSHSNPHGIAFHLAAKKHGVPVVLITHGMPIRPVARLSFDLAVVHCEAARETYEEEGCRMDQVLIHGRRQNFKPLPSQLPERLAVGIFLCKDVNEEYLKTLVNNLLTNSRVARVIVRPHPKNLWIGLDEWINGQNNERLQRGAGGSVFDDLKTVDVVIGGNSSVLVDAVTSGRVSAYARLDNGSPDVHKFVESGLIIEVDERPDFDAMLAFYQRPDWTRVLRRFANIDEDAQCVNARAIEIMRRLV